MIGIRFMPNYHNFTYSIFILALIIEDFVFSLEESTMQEVLARAIRGKGAFGRFYTGIQAYKIQDHWYKYQKDRLRKTAIEWCRQNRLAYK